MSEQSDSDRMASFNDEGRHPRMEDRSTGIELTYKELLSLTDSLAFSLQRSQEVHGARFVKDLHWRLTQARESISGTRS